MSTHFMPISMLLAAIIGFAVHRASICTVRAVAEVFTTRRAYMLVSFGKSVLWALAVMLVLRLWFSVPLPTSVQWELSAYGLLAGVLFGIGAAINRGCILSTLHQLADGKLAMVASLTGVLVGVLLQKSFASTGIIPSPTPASVDQYYQPETAYPVLIGLGIWILWETKNLLRSGRPTATIRSYILADRYRLSFAAALMGISNAVLYTLFGNWVFTSALNRTVVASPFYERGSVTNLWILFACLLIGMIVSSLQRGSFRLRGASPVRLAMNVLGGVLMGIGAAAAPGGNDTLIFGSIPNLSPHALPVYAAMVLGIALVFVTMKLIGGQVPIIVCRNDICRVHSS